MPHSLLEEALALMSHCCLSSQLKIFDFGLIIRINGSLTTDVWVRKPDVGWKHNWARKFIGGVETFLTKVKDALSMGQQLCQYLIICNDLHGTGLKTVKPKQIYKH